MNRRGKANQDGMQAELGCDRQLFPKKIKQALEKLAYEARK